MVETSVERIDHAEGQPLLANRPKKTPLPALQVAVVCFARLADPIAYTQIFPYVNQMVEDLKIAKKPSDIGFYSGLVDALFSVAQLLTIYNWGRLSDRIGRRPVVLMGLVGVAAATFCFGLSTSLTQMLISRSLAGGLSGNIAIISSVLGELTDKTNQAQAFALTGAVWGIGSIIGPLIGGALSHPAERYPELFGRFDLLKQHPFFLPCFVSSMLTVSSILVTYFLLEETLPSKVASAKAAALPPPSYGATDPQSTALLSSKTSTTETLLRDKHIQTMLIACFFLSFTCICLEVVLPLWAYTPIALGGLARTPAEIGVALSSTGVLGILNAFYTFPVLHARFGTPAVYTASMALWPIAFAIVPLITLCVQAFPSSPTAVAGVVVVSALHRMAQMGFAANMIMVKVAAPDVDSLGATFGIAQTVGCLGRAIAPEFVSSIFAVSVDKQILSGNLVWLVTVLVAIMGVIATFRLRER